MRKDVSKILHLTSSINGGAGLATLKIHNLLEQNGYNSKLIVGETISQKNLFSKTIYFTKKLFKIFIPKLLLIKRRKLRHNTYESAYCFYQKNELVKNGLKRNIINEIKRVDFVFVYWVSDFLNLYDIDYLKTKYNCKVIFVMLDHAHVSGGYHFLLEEYNNHLKKNNIEILKPDEILYKNQYMLKKEIHNKMSSEILVFSDKDLQLAKDCAFNFNKYWKTVLPIDNKFFNPVLDTKNETSIKTIFCCSYNFIDFRKGSEIFINVLKLLDGMSKSDQKIRVLCSKDASLKNLTFKSIFFDRFEYNENPEVYSSNYHESDLFIFTSIADSAPQMPSEALHCGIPVVSFNIANIQEIITEINDGYIINDFDEQEMANKIYELLFETKGLSSNSNKLKRYEKIKKYHAKEKTLNTLSKIIRKEL